MPAAFLIRYINGLNATAIAGPDLLTDLITAIIIGLVFTLAALLVNLALAWRQWREGKGTWLRLVCVCGFIGLLQVAPLIVFALVYNVSDTRFQDQIVPVWILIIWNGLLLSMSLGRPVKLAHTKDELPRVDDEHFNQRVSELASAMHLKTPVVRMVRSLSGEQLAAAFAGGLPAPSLVVTDGILHRLTPDERDAVVGHELAHLANGSLWWLTCVTPAAAIGGVLASAAAGGWYGVLFGLALRVGLLRMVSRYFEYDCDRRAARVIGFRTAASALAKIHAAHILRDAGWRSVLVYATATHPSLVERLAALESTAPAADAPDSRSSAAAAPRIFAARVAATLWCITLTFSLAGRCYWPTSVWPAVLVVAVLSVPFWPLLDTWRQLMRLRKRTRQGGWRKPLGLILVAAAVAAVFLFDDVDAGTVLPFILLQLAIALSGLFGILLMAGGAPFGSHRARQQLLKALQDHDFEAAVQIGADHPRAIERVPEFGHNVAVARILSGDWDNGIAELCASAERHPRFVHSLLTLSSFYFDAGDYGSAWKTARQAGERLKQDPEPLIQQAVALWRLGRLDESESAAREAMLLEPDAGEPHAVLAGVAIERGDLQGARDALDIAERLAPGLPFGRVLEAEWALRFAEPATARHAVAQAREAARANPFAVIDRQVGRLEARLLENQSPS